MNGPRAADGPAEPDRYDPEINATYAEMAGHRGVAIVPARPRKPKDKAKVEAGVLLAQRWILACLRNRRFFSLEELNDAIAELLERLNPRPFQRLDGCRRSAFESIDRPAMRALPASRYEVADWKNARVNIDYHVMYDDGPYSVPHAMVSTTSSSTMGSPTASEARAGCSLAGRGRGFKENRGHWGRNSKPRWKR